MATGKVEPRPKSTAFTGALERKVWDEKYKATHNTDGTRKGAVAKGRRGGIVDPVFPPLIKDKEAPKAAAPAAKKKSGFGDAFKAARAAGLSTFEFGGEKFNTMQKGESKEDHMAALAKIREGKLKPLKTVAEDRKALDETAAKKKAREEEVKKMVASAGLAKGGMVKKKKK
jgi:hypothetical protein